MSSLTENSTAWNSFVIKNHGCFLQSWEWSEFQKSLGRDVRRIVLGKEEEGIEAVASTILLPLPFNQKYLYIPRGPIFSGAVSEEKYGAALVALRAIMNETQCAFAKVDVAEEVSGEVSAVMLQKLGLVETTTTQPAHTSIINLGQIEEEMLAGMHQKTRYNIRLALKHGVTVREANHLDVASFSKDIDTFIALLSETTERDKFSGHAPSYYRAMLEKLAVAEKPGLVLRLRLAEHEGVAVAAGIFAEFGDTVTYLHGASKADARHLMGPFALHWETIVDAKKRGFSIYDFWGIAPEDKPNHPWAGITRFKLGFGGKSLSYLGGWELPGRGLWYRLYRAAKFLRR